MDDFLKQLLAAYVFLTVIFWFMCWGMESNHAAFAGNIAWRLISGISNVLNWIGIISVSGLVLMGVAAEFSSRQKKRLQDEGQLRERETAHEEYLERIRVREREEWEATKKAKEEELRRKKEHEDRLRQKQVKKQNRSAQDATRAALDDF